MLKGLKEKKAGKGDPKKDTKKDVGLQLVRNSPRKRPRNKRRKRKKLLMPWSRSISNQRFT